MEALFDLIFNNLPFLIIVIGGIFSFLKRASQGEAPQEKKKQFQPKLDWPTVEIELPKNEEHERKPYRPVMAKTKEESVPLEVELPVNPYLEKLRKMEAANESGERRVRSERSIPFEHSDPPSARLQVYQPAETVDFNFGRFNKKQAIEGMIWSEILGPPRAKKKHTYSYMRRS